MPLHAAWVTNAPSMQVSGVAPRHATVPFTQPASTFPESGVLSDPSPQRHSP
jgi:hypothetical protein